MAEIQFTIYIEEKLKKRFEKKADRDHRTMAGQIRQLIEEYVKEEPEND